jgi:hypothetical protein
MLTIHYPAPEFKIEKKEGREYIFDSVRKKWLLLTPEEWVRQNFVSYLIRIQSYPATLIAMEKAISLGELTKRFDILVYNPQHQPLMMVECKAPEVPLTDDVLHQLLRYHISVPTGFLIVTNGSNTYGWRKKANRLHLLEEMPSWEDAKDSLL